MKISSITKVAVAISATTLACLAIRGHRKIARCKAKCDAEIAASKAKCDAEIAASKAKCDAEIAAMDAYIENVFDSLSDEELLSLIIQIMSELDNTSESFDSDAI